MLLRSHLHKMSRVKGIIKKNRTNTTRAGREKERESKGGETTATKQLGDRILIKCRFSRQHKTVAVSSKTQQKLWWRPLMKSGFLSLSLKDWGKGKPINNNNNYILIDSGWRHQWRGEEREERRHQVHLHLQATGTHWESSLEMSMCVVYTGKRATDLSQWESL